jgi:hypothetical protein
VQEVLVVLRLLGGLKIASRKEKTEIIGFAL